MTREEEPDLVPDAFVKATTARNVQRIQRLNQTIKWAWILGILGITPFIVFAALLTLADYQNPLRLVFIDLLKSYSAVILSFIAGIRWGRVVQHSSSERGRLDLFWSTVPPFLGWLSILLPTPYVFAIQTLSYAAFGAWDAFAGQEKLLPDWFVKFRIVLTFAVCAVLMTAFFVTS